MRELKTTPGGPGFMCDADGNRLTGLTGPPPLDGKAPMTEAETLACNLFERGEYSLARIALGGVVVHEKGACDKMYALGPAPGSQPARILAPDDAPPPPIDMAARIFASRGITPPAPVPPPSESYDAPPPIDMAARIIEARKVKKVAPVKPVKPVRSSDTDGVPAPPDMNARIRARAANEQR